MKVNVFKLKTYAKGERMFNIKALIHSLFYLILNIAFGFFTLKRNDYFTIAFVFVLFVSTIVYIVISFKESIAEKDNSYLFTTLLFLVNFLCVVFLFNSKNLFIANGISIVFFLFVVIFLVVKEVIYPKAFNKWQIVGSVLTLYPTIGLVFAVLFATDHSLKGIIDVKNIIDIDSRFNYIYFSFVALSTVGFGDFSPNSTFSKLMVIIESFLNFVLFGILISGAFGIPKRTESLEKD
jgi:voltage-gated potassium channel